MEVFFSPEQLGRDLQVTSQTVRNRVESGIYHADGKVGNRFLFRLETVKQIKELNSQINKTISSDTNGF